MAGSPFGSSASIFKGLLILLFLSNFISPELRAGDGGLGIDPEEEKKAHVELREKDREEISSLGQLVAEQFLKIYRNYISPVIGAKCPCYPSCSQYAFQAIKKHDLFLGLLLTFDRLLHEADEVQRAPLIEINGELRYYDPVENNDFWWYKE